MPVAEAAAIIDTYRVTDLALRDRTLAFVDALWASLPDYRDPSMDRFVATAGPALEGAQRQAAVATDVYLAALEAAQTGEAVTPAGVPAETSSTISLRGVEAAEVWRRPAVTVYRALADGLSIEVAAERGRGRARQLAETNLQLAHTHAARSVLGRRRTVTGYRRVTRGGKSCALCLLAATQRYRKGELLPIHPGCHCTVATIVGRDDPGPVLDREQVAAIHRTVGAFTGSPDPSGRPPTGALYRDLIVTHEHGEIGPVLGVRGQGFTGPGDL